jgi:hypothetical protein
MVRTQVYLTRAQHGALRRQARARKLSMTELLRRLVDEHLSGRRGVTVYGKEAILALGNLGASGRSDTSERHDDALDEAFRAGAVR